MTYGINTANAPKPQGCCPQGAAAGRYVFVSGQVGDNPQTQLLVSDDVAGQTRQAIAESLRLLADKKRVRRTTKHHGNQPL